MGEITTNTCGNGYNTTMSGVNTSSWYGVLRFGLGHRRLCLHDVVWSMCFLRDLEIDFPNEGTHQEAYLCNNLIT